MQTDLPGAELLKQGAEARVYTMTYLNRPTIVKERFSKQYRHPDLDAKITKERLSIEVKCMLRCRKLGIDAPSLFCVDKHTHRIFMEQIDGRSAREFLMSLPCPIDQLPSVDPTQSSILSQVAASIGASVAKLHDGGIIHGDLTTSNLLLRAHSNSVVVIDFGLAYHSQLAEDKAVDLYVLERALSSTHPNSESFFQLIMRAYEQTSKHSKLTLQVLKKVRARGRKRVMLG